MYLKEEHVQFQKKQFKTQKRKRAEKYEEKLQTPKNIAEVTKIVFP